jgi:1-acyl-sn-glycerol-3-phosphate acyltransferase
MRLFGHIFYRYLWISFNSLLFYFYRYSPRKHSSGRDKVPSGVPVLLCSNHPNAFMDALLLGSTVKRRTWFLARSDVFRKKWLANFLSFIGIIPIYRLLEGVENLSKNDETFDKCSKMLEEKKAIMIFSEGLCIQERRLRKLKKGTARIAFGSEEKNDFKLGIMIVPVGMNYSATPWKFRSPLFVNFGNAFPLSDYETLYRTDKPRAMNQFTRDLEGKMRELLLVIEDKENDRLVAQLEEMFVEEQAAAAGLDPRNQKETFEISRGIANTINAATKADPERVNALREKTASYFSTLKQHGLRDWLFSDRIEHQPLIGDLLILLAGFPLWLFGTITNFVPFKIPWLIQKKIVKNIEWSASVNGTIAVFLWQIWWLLQSLAVALVFRNWYLLGGFMLAVPLCGVIAAGWYRIFKKMRGRIRKAGLGKDEALALAQLRKSVVTDYNSL